MSDKTPSVFRSIKNDTGSRSDLPILHALVNPAIQAVAICAEYQTDIPALIFSQYATFAEELAKIIKKEVGVQVLLLTGSVSRKKREQLIEQFQDANTPSIFVISLKAGGTGLNLTKATHVFHIDRRWNPAVEDQATDRTYRIGRKRNVQVYLMIAAGTLEERIDQMNLEKRSLAQEVLASGDELLINLSTKELLEIVSLRDSVFTSEEEV